MAEPAPNKTVSSAGMRPVPSSGVNYVSAPAHHVKKLIKTYTQTAERSMLGPAAMSAPTELPSSYSKFYGNYHHPYPSQMQTQTYKLPPDVELSKSSPDEDSKGNQNKELESEKTSAADPPIVPYKRSASLHRRDSTDRQKSDDAGQHHGKDDFKHLQQNGQVTLSKVDDRQRHGSSHSDGTRAKSCDSSHSGSSGRHLTGEMIRQLQEQKKEPRPPPPPPTAAQILEMKATAAAYERALIEKSYLKGTNLQRPSSGTAAPPLPPPAFKTPTTSGPVFLSRDRGHSDLQETRLAGKDIACFLIGGERRLCLPQIFNSVLYHLSLHDIHAACEELRICCATCSPEQLARLKRAEIIPVSASQCGLITKSDAERLCSALLDRTPPIASLSGFHAKSSPFSFRVQHFCFGTCRGILLPEAYTSPAARCIECLECEGLFCPQKFVCHSHRNRENRTCHWGFDSAHWRSYLLLSDDYTQAEKERLGKGFSDFKARYNAAKRKQSDSSPQNPPTNGLTASNREAPPQPLIKTEEPAKNAEPEGVPQSKKPRLPDLPPPPGAVPTMFPGDPAYGLYLYQSWAQAAAKMGTGAAGPLHPAAAAAWSAHIAQAVKDGKNSVAKPFPDNHSSTVRLVGPPAVVKASPTNPGIQPLASPASLTSRPSETRVQLPNLKASPISESESPSQAFDSSSSQGDTSSPTTQSHPPTRRPSSSSSTSRPSLAEDIHSIRLSLEGASSTAREKILKILERLTARLAVAESERDGALSQLRQLQKRFDQLEDELHKKRAELREALRQDGGGIILGSQPHQKMVRTNGDRTLLPGPSNHRSSVTLELLSNYKHEDEPDELDSVDDFVRGPSYVERHPKTFTSVVLPKIDMKSPATVIEEKERMPAVANMETPVRFRSRSPSPSSSSGATINLQPDLPIPSPSGSELEKRMIRRRSGTPGSIKSRESEDLRERMLTMEAELRALREELTNRPTNKKLKLENDQNIDLSNFPASQNIESSNSNRNQNVEKNNGSREQKIETLKAPNETKPPNGTSHRFQSRQNGSNGNGEKVENSEIVNQSNKSEKNIRQTLEDNGTEKENSAENKD